MNRSFASVSRMMVVILHGKVTHVGTNSSEPPLRTTRRGTEALAINVCDKSAAMHRRGPPFCFCFFPFFLIRLSVDKQRRKIIKTF